MKFSSANDEDPLAALAAMETVDRVSNSSGSPTKLKYESLTIRLSDEIRIVQSMTDAAKKKTSGVIFTVKVNINGAKSLGIGVKDLQDKIVAVSMLKRVNSAPGSVEVAGIRLGDIVFGINFQPLREGSRSLLQSVKREMDRKRSTLHFQVECDLIFK